MELLEILSFLEGLVLVNRRNTIKITATLSINNNMLLYLSLDDEGNIERFGNGTIENDNLMLFQGKIEPFYFNELIQTLTDEDFINHGIYKSNNKNNNNKITVTFENYRDEKIRYKILYKQGQTHSMERIAGLVYILVSISEDWWQEHVKNIIYTDYDTFHLCDERIH